MTYTKSSAKHSAHGDFLRCFKSMFWFPLTAFLIHAGNYISTISSAYAFSKSSYQYILFDYEMYYSDRIATIQLLMLIAGALTAFFTFSFVRKVPQYNIYLSLPVTRTTLFVNRTKVAAIYFAIASFVPTLLALLLNFILFKPNGYLVGICLMFGLAFFATAMIGYAVSAAISLAVGKAYEALLFTGVALFALPGIITNSISFFIGGLVNGGVGYNSSSVLSYFTKDYSQYNYWIKPYKFFINAEKFECLDRISKYPKLTIDVIGPVLLMLCIAMIILVLGAITFNNRKAENAGVVGANKPLVIGTGAVCAYAILYFCAYLIGGESTRIPAAIAGVVLSVVTYLLTCYYAALSQQEEYC